MQFHNGRLYRYNGVPSDTFVAVLTDQESTGKAFGRLVKDRAFPYTAIEPEEAVGL